MAGHRFGRSLVVALAGFGMLAAGSGAAHARPATVVLSDKIKFGGTATGSTPPGTWSFSTGNCKETSDGETAVYPCKLSGQIMKNSAGGLSGFFNLNSADGGIQWKYTLTPTSNPNVYVMKGAGAERDMEGGVVTNYPATMKGLMKLVPSGPNLLVTGAVSVWESSTAP
jgi:hypothetical protein